MKNRLSIVITLAILVSGSSMASLDSILEQFAKLEISAMNSNLCDLSNIFSHLDMLITNNNSMPEAWLPQPCCEQEAKLKKEIEIIDEHDLRDYLSQFDDCGDVADKLLILKDHEYYHCILLQTVIGIRRHYSTKEYGTPHYFTDKDVARRKACESIIQATREQLISEGRYFEERPHCARKLSYSSSMKARAREEELEGKPLKDKYSNACDTDKDSERSVCTSVLLYMSEGVWSCLNCQVYRNGELVACCHLAAWWLGLNELKYETIASEENIARCKEIPGVAELKKSFSQNGCPTEGMYFEINTFPKVIHDVAITMIKGQDKRYLVNSGNHSMGLCIKRNKYNNIIVYYYDPNDTLRHKEIIANTVGDLEHLSYDDFWSPVYEQCYFPEQAKICCIVSLETTVSQQDCNVVCTHKPSAILMYLLSKFGHYGHPAAFFDLKDFDKNKKKVLIAGEKEGGTPALYVACNYGHLESVFALLAMVANVDLDPDVKKVLFVGRRADGTSSLFIACENGYSEIVSALIAGVFSSDLNFSNGEKVEFLAGKNSQGYPALYIACQNGHYKTITALMNAICRDDLNLSNHEKAELMAGESKDGCSALYMASQNGFYESVYVFIAEICRGDFNLDNDKKAELLSGKNGGGTPALYIACQEGYHGIVTILIDAICSGNLNLNKDVKVELLAGKSEVGYPGLYIACERGRHKSVTVLIAAICRDDFNLDNAQKVELLAGKNKYGFHALYQACAHGHLEIVRSLVSAICSDDLNFSKAEKTELLLGKNVDGVSALEVASCMGYDRIVEVLRDCGM